MFRSSLSPHKNVWEGTFDIPGQKAVRLVFSTTPEEIALFTDRWSAPKKSNTYPFFESLSGSRVTGAALAHNDRYITLWFEQGIQLLFQLFGHRANLFHAENGKVIGTFKNRNELKGTDVPKPRASVTTAGRAENTPDDEMLSARKKILSADPKFPRHLIAPVVRQYRLDEKNSSQVQDVLRMLTEAIQKRAEFRLLEDGNLCLIPTDLLPLQADRIFDEINEAIRFTYYKASGTRRFRRRLNSIRPALVTSSDKIRAVLQQLRQRGKTAERAAGYEKMGHLLMTRAHEERTPGQETLEVPDLYETDSVVTIPLRANLSIAENAQYYYDKASKARRNIQEAERRETIMMEKLAALEQLIESLDQAGSLGELEKWAKMHRKELEEAGMVASGAPKTPLPWRKTEIDGYEIRIGKNAAGNDKLTSTSHKEDIWLHARGAGGSHVIIRMENRPQMPPKKVVRQAASYAAWHSKLRGSKLVPVIVTKRKYVNKPKGAPPGSVRVQREEVEMVAPVKP